MHLSEFKAWFEGFTENIDGPPNAKQWKKICERVKEITADYTPAPVFIDRYVYPYRRYFDGPYWSSGGVMGTSGGYGTAISANNTTPALADWSAAGRAEFNSLSAGN